jgi:hypothetical protein
MNTLAKFLKPGVSVYSPIFGTGKVESIDGDNIKVSSIITGVEYLFIGQGQFEKNGECLLFPSRENRDWGKFLKPKFSPFDKIVARNTERNATRVWHIDFFEHFDQNTLKYIGMSGCYNECLPYNEETVKLIETTKDV